MSKDSDNIQVIIRVRPLNRRELEETDDCKRCVMVDQPSQKRLRLDDSKIGPRDFEFDWIGDESTSQEQIFESVGKSMVERCLKGYNCCIFAYGQTGAGKTYTMQGRDLKDCGMNDSDRGLQPRVFDYLFDMISRETTPGTIFTVSCSYLEIYNEQFIDLLTPKNIDLKLREEKEGPYLQGLTEAGAEDPTVTMKLLRRGVSNRHVGSTRMNSESSRSHSIFTLTIECKTIFEALTTTRKSKFHFVDLAGSERQSQTNSMGERLKEAGNINKSLSVLGQVIKSIVESASFTRYRDSKLTYLLKDSLGGNSKTALIANISPSSDSFQETKSTLLFASSAKQIKNKAQVNEGVRGNIEDLKNEIKRLKEIENSVNQLKIEHNEQVEKLMLEINCLRQSEAEAIGRANLETQRCQELQKEFEETRRNDEQNFNNRLQEMQQEASRLQALTVNNAQMDKLKEDYTNQAEKFALEMNELRKKEMESSKKAVEESQKWSALQDQIEENKRANDLEVSQMTNDLETLRANNTRLEKVACDMRCENSKLKNEANRTDGLYKNLCERNQVTERKLNEALANNAWFQNETRRLTIANDEWQKCLETNEFQQRTEVNKFTEQIKKLEAICLDKDINLAKLESKATELEMNCQAFLEANIKLLTEKESYASFASTLNISAEEPEEASTVSEPIMSRNQHFDNWQKKIDKVFKAVLKVDKAEGDGMEFEDGEELDYEDAINGLMELEEQFYDQEEELKSTMKVSRQRQERKEHQQVKIRTQANQREYRVVNPVVDENMKRANKERRTKLNMLEVELEKEQQRKSNVKDILVRVFEHTKKVNKVYEQEIQELTAKLNETKCKEKTKKDLHLRIKWYEKQVEEKTVQIKQYEENVEEMKKQLESSADKEELKRVEKNNSDLKAEVKELKNKCRDSKADIKELEKKLGESKKKTKDLEKQSAIIQIKANQNIKNLNKFSKLMKSARENEEERFKQKELFYKTMEQELASLSQNCQSMGQPGEDKENMSPSGENRTGKKSTNQSSESTNLGKRTVDDMLELFTSANETNPQTAQFEDEFDLKIKRVKYNQ